MTESNQAEDTDLKQQRWELLEHVHDLLEKPLLALSLVWVLLLIFQLTIGLGPLLQTLVYVIWSLFILDFGIEVIIAPNKLEFLRRHWLSAVSLVLPALGILRALRALRLFQVARAARSLNLLRLITSLNRGMRIVRRTIGSNTIAHAVAITILVIFAGAAGMYNFESPLALQQAGYSGPGFQNYGDAVWWTAMMMTTMGSDYFPKTVEGRVRAWLLAVYTFSIFGFVTAAFATLLIGQQRTADNEAQATAALEREVTALRTQVQELVARLNQKMPRS